MGQPVSALGRLLKGIAQGLRVLRPQPQFKLGLEYGQRRAQLMGGVRNKLRLTGELPAQALGKMIECLYQWPQLALHRHQRQWPQVIHLALLHGIAQTLQRAQCRTDGKPHHQQRPQPQHAQAQQGVRHQATGHCHPRLVGLGYTDFRHAVHAGFAHSLEQAHHTHVLAQIGAVIEPRQRRIIIGARRACRRRRQVFITGNQPLVDIVDLIVNTPGAVVGKGIKGNVGHIRTQAAITLRQPGGNGARRCQQGTVIRRIGRLATIEISTQAACQHQHHQQQRQVPQQAPAQAVELKHRGLPANTPGP